MSGKKISFGFTKVTQKSNLVGQKPVEVNNRIELIDCLEGQTIKIKDAIEEIKKPLVIPIKENSKNLLDRVRDVRNIKTETAHIKSDSELTLDELAAKQLIEEAKSGIKVKQETKVLTLPNVPDKVATNDTEESTLDDYENIPIADYGFAMLRGMGWTEGSGIGKNQRITKPIEPELRPKGMGLGVSKLINAEKKPPPVDKNGEELLLIKGAFAKIIAGTHKGSYCEVLGLDDESGRIIVKTSIKSQILSLNEFLVQVVTKEEYVKSSKVINIEKYEEYKEKSKIKKEEYDSDDCRSNKAIRDRSSSRKQHRSDHKSSSKSDRSCSYYQKKTHKYCDQSHSSDDDHTEGRISGSGLGDKDKDESKERKRESRSKNDSSEYRKKKKRHKQKEAKKYKKKSKSKGGGSDSEESDENSRRHSHGKSNKKEDRR